MKKYEVLSNTVTGIDGRAYVKGQTITEDKLKPGVAAVFVARKRIVEITHRVIPEKGKIKLAIVTSVWKRPEVFEMFAKGIKHLRANCKNFEISVIVSGSEWDVSKKMVEQYGYTYIEIPNEPLAAKVNATTFACRKLEVDYVLCVGSDDITSVELLNEYEIYMRKGIDFIGVTDCYFYDMTSKKALYWAGYRENYRKGHTVGAFRAISARLLSLWDWMPWENKDSGGLDRSMQIKLKHTPHTIHTFNMKQKGLYALDIKSSTNMTPFKQWDNSVFIDSKEIENKFDYVWY